MSIYIDFVDKQNKKDWIVEHGVMRHMGDDKSHLDFDDIKRYGNGGEDLVLVVWGKPSFEVLIVIHTAEELTYFDLDDGIEKFWAYVPIKNVMDISDKYKLWYYNNNPDVLNNNLLVDNGVYAVRGNYSHPYILIESTKYIVDLDFTELGLDLDGDTVKIDKTGDTVYANNTTGKRVRMYVLKELRFDMTIDIDGYGDSENWVALNTDMYVKGITSDTKYSDILRKGDIVLVVWRKTNLLDVLAVVYDELEFTRHNLDDGHTKVWAYVSIEVVTKSCRDYKKMLFRPNISNGMIKKEALRKILRRYEKQSKRKFNPKKIKYENNNIMLLALYSEANSFAEIAVHDGIEISVSREIAADALLYLIILGLREY